MTESDRQWRADYEASLASPRWRWLRERVIERDGGRCALCAETERLEVHHLHYRTMGREAGDELLTLCARCHDRLRREGLRLRESVFTPLLARIV